MPDVAALWSGWIRRPSARARWRLFCRGTEQECYRLLLDRAPAGCDKLVRQGEGDPNETHKGVMRP